MVGIVHDLLTALSGVNNATGEMLWINFTDDPEVAGFIPGFLSVHDPRPAVEQIADNYAHGGGWNSFTHVFRPDFANLEMHSTVGDPPIRCMAMSILRGEIIMLFEHDWLVIIQPDGTWDCARLD